MQKNFKSQTLVKQLFAKCQIFTKLPKISHIHKNRNFLSIIELSAINWEIQYTYVVRWLKAERGHNCKKLFIFGSCQPLTGKFNTPMWYDGWKLKGAIIVKSPFFPQRNTVKYSKKQTKQKFFIDWNVTNYKSNYIFIVSTVNQGMYLTAVYMILNHFVSFFKWKKKPLFWWAYFLANN